MKLLREDFIHYHMRASLRATGWQLLAGQYPNGSDDELRALYVVDPTVARDNSPMPRRHSLDKLVPDLVAYRSGVLLVVEAKPEFDPADEAKLVDLLTSRRVDFDAAVAPLLASHGVGVAIQDLKVTPALAFSAGAAYRSNSAFGYLLVRHNGDVVYLEPGSEGC